MSIQKKLRIMLICFIGVCVFVLIILLLNKNKVSPQINSSKIDNNIQSIKKRSVENSKYSSNPNAQNRISEKDFSKEHLNPVFVGTADSDLPREIVLNSGDEPGRAEAPEIKLDENDVPILDEKGNPLLK